MRKRELIKSYKEFIEKWMLDNRKLTVGILFTILIFSFAFVIARKRDKPDGFTTAFSTLNKVKSNNSVKLTTSISDLKRNLSVLSDLQTLKELDSLSREDSLKLEEITQSIIKD